MKRSLVGCNLLRNHAPRKNARWSFRWAVILLTVTAAAVGLTTAPNTGSTPAPSRLLRAAAAAPTTTCPNGATVTTAAHQDDSLFFQSPDIIHDIHSGRCLRSIYVTAGDAGLDRTYWSSRENGVRASYASMAGVSNLWTQTDAGIPGHPMPVLTLAGNPRVSLVFMRLPSGGTGGAGSSRYGFQSLQKLYFGTITTMTTVDGSSSYSRSDLTTTLTALIEAMTPDRIDTQDFTGVYGDGDHSDHHTVAYLTREAHRRYTTVAHTLVGYMDYALAQQPANLSGADFTAKHDAFFAYAPYDMNVCQTDATCKQGTTWAYLSAQYTTGSEAGGPGTSYPPFAVVGPDQTVGSGAPVQLLGAASNDGGGTPSFQWTQTSGPAVTLSSASAASPTFTAPASASVLRFELTVTEGQRTSAPAGMTVAVAPPIVVASPQYGIPNQTDVFSVASNGAIEVYWVQGAGRWNGPLPISSPGTAPPGAHLAASNQFGIPNQTDVFVVGNDGATKVMWVNGAGKWNGPISITPTNTSPSGAALATSNQFGISNQTDVFMVANSGATDVSWVQGAGAWTGPRAITPTGTAPAGAHLAASNQFGIPNRTDVFVVANSGATDVSWVQGAGAWTGPMAITPTGTAPAGADLAASNQFGIPSRTDVFVVDKTGRTQVAWVDANGAWNGPLAITPTGTAPAGAHLAASNQFGISNQTDVFVVANSGATDVSWVQGAGAWNGPTAITPRGTAPAGAALDASNQFGISNQTDVFAVVDNGAPRVSWVQGAGVWQGPLRI